MNRVELIQLIKVIIKQVLEETGCNEYISPKKIAEKLEVDPMTVRRWCRSGELKAYRFGAQMRVKTSDLAEFCNNRGLSV